MSSHSKTAAQRSIDLHIEELVLHGFSVGDRYRIADALQLELGKLLSEASFSLPTVFDSGADLIDAGTFRINSTSSRAVGSQIAQALFGGLARKTGETDSKAAGVEARPASDDGATLKETR